MINVVWWVESKTSERHVIVLIVWGIYAEYSSKKVKKVCKIYRVCFMHVVFSGEMCLVLTVSASTRLRFERHLM